MKKKATPYYLYLLRCKDQTLYAGITIDLTKRLAAHNAGKGSAYVRSRGGGKIIYSEFFKNKSLALKREAAIKNMSRSDKLNLIKLSNKKRTSKLV